MKYLTFILKKLKLEVKDEIPDLCLEKLNLEMKDEIRNLYFKEIKVRGEG